jgi:UDP-N-acetylmuramyl pentapeptide synthase
VLGGLREQGDYLEKGYQRIYKMAVQAKIDELILCDIDEKYFPAVSGAGNGNTMRVHHVPDHATCATYIEDTYTPNEIILFKGSRGARMEEVIGILSVV